jgi:hypothetical protein
MNTPVVETLRHLSNKDFASFGMNDIAYIKPVSMQGEARYAVHAADGTPLTVVADREVAQAAVRQYEMEPLSLH